MPSSGLSLRTLLINGSFVYGIHTINLLLLIRLASHNNLLDQISRLQWHVIYFLIRLTRGLLIFQLWVDYFPFGSELKLKQ